MCKAQMLVIITRYFGNGCRYRRPAASSYSWCRSSSTVGARRTASAAPPAIPVPRRAPADLRAARSSGSASATTRVTYNWPTSTLTSRARSATSQRPSSTPASSWPHHRTRHRRRHQLCSSPRRRRCSSISPGPWVWRIYSAWRRLCL